MRTRYSIAALLVLAAVAPGQQRGAAAIDTEEWRDRPVRHLYIHGVLNGDTTFQVRLPERSAWKGRLLHFLEGTMGGYEKTGESIGEHAYALANGAVYVESNQGHRGLSIYRPEDTLKKIAYEASRAVVLYARSRCLALYGREPDYSYVYGQSGGGFRATGLLERFPKLYDGAVPIFGAGQMKALLLFYSVYGKYRSALEGYAPALADAVRPGGSGDPFRALPTAEAKKALEAILTAGFPLSQVEKIENLLTAAFILDILRYKIDPEYLDEFWTKPGYPGAGGLLTTQLQEFQGEVKALGTAPRTISFVASLNRKPGNLACYTVRFTSGAMKGEVRNVAGSQGDTLVLSPLGPGLEKLKTGDRFRLDNRDALAMREYYRYIAEPDEPALGGIAALHPTRPASVLDALGEPGRPVGRFAGKMIAVFSVDDEAAWPTLALRYARQVEKALGKKAAARQFRLHFIEKAPHAFTVRPPWEVSWFAPAHKMLDDLIAWVEQGTEPPPGTRYSVSRLSQIVLPERAAQRRGYQPVVTLTANGKRALLETGAGSEVVFVAGAEDPDNELARLEMDFDADGKFDESVDVRGSNASHTFRHAYAKPGTYFATVRVTDSTVSKGAPASGIQNLAHVRVVVRESMERSPETHRLFSSGATAP